MSEQVLNQFRSDKALREDCIAIYEAMGMDLNTAFRMFMERTRMVRGLPFPATLPETRMTREEARQAIDDLRAEAAGLPEMTLDEINAEIAAARAERKRRERDRFSPPDPAGGFAHGEGAEGRFGGNPDSPLQRRNYEGIRRGTSSPEVSLHGKENPPGSGVHSRLRPGRKPQPDGPNPAGHGRPGFL